LARTLASLKAEAKDHLCLPQHVTGAGGYPIPLAKGDAVAASTEYVEFPTHRPEAFFTSRNNPYEVPVRGADEEEREYEMPRPGGQHPHDVPRPLYATASAVAGEWQASSSSSSDPVYDLGSASSHITIGAASLYSLPGRDSDVGSDAVYDFGSQLAPPETLYDDATVGTFALCAAPIDADRSTPDPDMSDEHPVYTFGNPPPEDGEPMYATATASSYDYEL